MLNVKLGKVVAWASQNDSLAEKAAKEFFGNKLTKIDQSACDFERIIGLFNEWLIFDYKNESGRTPLVEYALKNPDKLTGDLVNELGQIIKTQRFEFLEIELIKRGGWIETYGLFSGNRYKIFDIKASLSVPEKGSFWGRMALVDGKWHLVGSDSVFLPVVSSPRLRKMYLKNKSIFTPKEAVILMFPDDSKKGPLSRSNKISASEIGKKKKLLRKKYLTIRKEYKIEVSFEKVIGFIYNENYKTNFADYMTDLIKLGIADKAVVKHVQIFNDLWNYFPHKSLGGRAPVEIYHPDNS